MTGREIGIRGDIANKLMNNPMTDLASKIHALVVTESQKTNMPISESFGAITLVHANWANIYHWAILEKNYPSADEKIAAIRDGLPAKNPSINMRE